MAGRYKKRGWFKEPKRHYLAAKGIKTSRYNNGGSVYPPGFNYATRGNKGVLTGIFNEAFDFDEDKQEQIGSFNVGQNNSVTRAIDKLMNAPTKAMQSGVNFEVKAPKGLRKEDFSQEFTEFEELEPMEEQYMSHHYAGKSSLPWVDNLSWSDKELELISEGNPPQDYINLYEVTDVPQEHRKKARIELERRDEVPGGVADNALDSEFDPNQLKKGMKYEMIHTDDKQVAKELAQDNLKADPLYYERLEKAGIEA